MRNPDDRPEVGRDGSSNPRNSSSTQHHIPRELEAPDGKKLDLFKDLVSDGKVEIWLRCEEPQQNFGVAQADMYLRAGNASFALNFAKGYLGIWLQLLVVITIGVMFSTFLSGPVAMVATLGVLGGRILQRLHVAPGHAADLRRRAVRIAVSTAYPAEHDLGIAAGLARPPW